jgi:hypothetical protein
MPNITILQADDRPNLYYLLLTQQVNKNICDHFGYKYVFITIDKNKYYTNVHPATKKIYIVNEFLNDFSNHKDTNDTKDDILVFLDSDAWVQNGFWLDEIIKQLQNNVEKQGCFSRDTYKTDCTFINSGSFILKINDYTRKIYSEIINSLENDKTTSYYKKNWPYDQFYISNYVFNHKEDFYIFVPDILNTPLGKVLRHNWWKNKRMYNDLNHLIENNVIEIDKMYFCHINKSDLDFKKYIDAELFPNTDENECFYLA